MITISSLLNPVPSHGQCHFDSPNSTPRTTQSPKPSLSSQKKAIVSKPAAMLVKACPVGQVRYGPYESQDDMTKTEHQRFSVKPVGSISECPRHIPYNSEKRTFQERTGRDAFEAFQYTFRMPGDPSDKEPHVVMWDYNVGLVRITSFFKSLKYPKTMPAKVMTANPGLKEISHSITGGSISAQGYWIPFQAARAIAARFCWEIRYVLTPVFGAGFPASCVQPGDPTFLKLGIDKAIIHHCTKQANGFRKQFQVQSAAPNTQSLYQSTGKALRPQSKSKPDYESGYGTDTDRSGPNSPASGCNGWTPVNAPQPQRRGQTPLLVSRVTPTTTSSVRQTAHLAGTESRQRKRLLSTEDEPSIQNGRIEVASQGTQKPKRSKRLTEVGAARAAYTLVQLHNADATFAERQSLAGRRASW